MNKFNLIICLIIFGIFLFFGCTEIEENKIPITNVTDSETETTLYFFYDPSWDLTAYNELIINLEEKLPGLKIDRRCIDIQKYTQNISSVSENLCVENIGYLKYNENMKLLNEIQITQSNFVLKVEDQTVEIPIVPISTAFAKNICLESPTTEGCNNLKELDQLNVFVIVDFNLIEDQTQLTTFFKTNGLPLNITIIEYTSDKAKQYLSEEITTIPILLITEDAKENISEEQQTLLEQFVLMGYFQSLESGNIYMKLPGTEKYIGPKFDEANIELFVMSYCPYGLQSQKAILPVKAAFGEDLNLTIRFVDYIMHGKKEIDENNIQYCLQKDDPSTLFKYLECFTISGNTTECLTQVNKSHEDLVSCIEELDKTYNIDGLYEDKSTWSNGVYPQYPVDTIENDLYGVRGSPTLVFNGITMSWGRSPEAIKQGICNMLENPPDVCNKTLSTATASPSFGGGTGTTSTGTC